MLKKDHYSYIQNYMLVLNCSTRKLFKKLHDDTKLAMSKTFNTYM